MNQDPNMIVGTGDFVPDPAPGCPADLPPVAIRAMVIAHTIRLGKCPQPGQVLGFTGRYEQGDDERALAGDLSDSKPVTEKRLYRFEVTAEDIRDALALLEAEKVTYPKPKVSVMDLRK